MDSAVRGLACYCMQSRCRSAVRCEGTDPDPFIMASAWGSCAQAVAPLHRLERQRCRATISQCVPREHEEALLNVLHGQSLALQPLQPASFCGSLVRSA